MLSFPTSPSVRLGVIAGALAIAGLATALTAGTANAAGETTLVIDASNTSIKSVQIGASIPPSNQWSLSCLPLPNGTAEFPEKVLLDARDWIGDDTDITIDAFTSADCSGEFVGDRKALTAPAGVAGGTWTVGLETLGL